MGDTSAALLTKRLPLEAAIGLTSYITAGHCTTTLSNKQKVLTPQQCPADVFENRIILYI